VRHALFQTTIDFIILFSLIDNYVILIKNLCLENASRPKMESDDEVNTNYCRVCRILGFYFIIQKTNFLSITTIFYIVFTNYDLKWIFCMYKNTTI
jgi:hypothetical protein